MIRVRDLRKAYGAREALRGVSLDVKRGEGLAVLGANGAGKTTLLSILTGALRPDAGEARVDGVPAHEARRRGLVGLVPQAQGLYPQLTCAENVRFFARLHGVPRTRARDETARRLAAVGLADRGRTRAGALSGGLRQRLSLAVALAHDPPVLLLDEPTTGLDPAARERVWALVETAREEENRAIVVCTHHYDEAARLAHRAVFLQAGTIVGTADGADAHRFAPRFREAEAS